MNMAVQPGTSLVWEDSAVILEAYPAGVVICDEFGVITYINSELLKMFGYAKHELLGQPVEVLIPHNSRATHPQMLHAFMQTPAKRNMGNGRELYAVRRDGSSFPVEIGLNPINSSSGKQVLATVADISERVRSENNFKNVVSAAPIGMLIMGMDGNINHCNQYLLDMFGYEAHELENHTVEILIPARHKEQHPDYRQNFLQDPSTRAMGLGRDLTGLHKSGIELPVEIGLNPINTANGTAIIATVVDITERKKAELQLRQINADLDEFTYVASHDLKSPLRGISELVKWIEEDLGKDINTDVKHNLDRVHVRIERMEKLIEDLLAYARSGRQSGAVTSINLEKLINNVIELCEVEGYTITKSGYLGEILSPLVPLETVLRNLISNAVKHNNKNKGNISVHVELEDAFCRFEVQDDGPGIPKNAHERIFKLFQSLSNSENSRSGVGLAVCKRLIEAYNGRIEVDSDSEQQRGSCFRFWWPRVARRDVND